MNHPNFFDSVFVRVFPRYLYHHQTASLISGISVVIIRKHNTSWQPTDTVFLKSGSEIRFLGLAKKLHILDKSQRDYSVFEILHNQPDANISPGDLIIITPTNRQYVYPKLMV